MSAVPVQKPIIVPRPKPQLRVEQGVRPSLASQVLARAVVLSVLTAGFFMASSLAGHVMVEKARREGLRATERARDAAKSESLLRDQVQSLTRASVIDTWALESGMVPPESLLATQESYAKAIR